MAASKSQIAATKKYNNKSYDNINFTVKKGDRNNIKAHAESQGESLNGFINRAISEAIERDNARD